MQQFLILLACLVTLNLGGQSFEWNKQNKGEDAGAGFDRPTAAYDAAFDERQVGYAEEYSPLFAGRETAFGERYDPGELTAGHALLPLGTLVEVTNLANDRSVTVRINGKEQACTECLISLSTAAAKALSLEVRAQVSVKRTGFSNWNPKVTDAPQSARTARVTPTVFDPAPARQPATERSVLDREVTPGLAPNRADYAVAGTPTTYSTTPAPSSGQTSKQAAPPAPTVPAYQQGRSAPAPKDYPMPSTVQVAKKPAPVMAAAPAPTAELADKSVSGAAVQLGAYSNQDYASNQVTELRAKGLTSAFYRSAPKADGSMIHRVYSGTYADRAKAQEMAAYIRDVYQVGGMVVEIK